MLPKKHRLPLTYITPLVGQRYPLQDLTLISVPNNLNFARAAFIVSKKVSTLATRRNFIKRQLAHAFFHSLLITTSRDYLFIAKKSAQSRSYSDYIDQLNRYAQS